MFYEIVERTFALERAGRRVVRMHIGDTNLPTPAPALDAARAALDAGRSTYGPAAGLPELRERIARREGCTADEVVVGPGSKHLLFGLFSVLGRPGARVAVPLPYYPAYELAARQLGMDVVLLPADLDGGWAFDRGPWTDDWDVLVLCNPLNPTSTQYAPASIDRALGAARARGAHVILDEAYRGLSFRQMPRSEGVRVRSFSKEFNMEGWRLGYAIAPPPVARALCRFIQTTTTCVPDFVQRAGLACLEREGELLARHRDIWRERSTAAQEALHGAGFRFAEPEGGMYVFATHEALADAGAYALRLLEEHGIAVAPGTGFGPFERFVRICVNLPPEELRSAVATMAAALPA